MSQNIKLESLYPKAFLLCRVQRSTLTGAELCFQHSDNGTKNRTSYPVGSELQHHSEQSISWALLFFCFFCTKNVNSNYEMIHFFFWLNEFTPTYSYLYLTIYLHVLETVTEPRLFHTKTKRRWCLTCDHITEHKLIADVVQTSGKSSLMLICSLTLHMHLQISHTKAVAEKEQMIYSS